MVDTSMREMIYFDNQNSIQRQEISMAAVLDMKWLVEENPCPIHH